MTTKFNREAFARVFNESGLTKTELGEIYGVTRQTLYDWLGHSEPTGSHRRHYVEKYTQGLLAAIEKRILPFPPGLSKEVRRRRIDMISYRLHELAKPRQPL